MRRIARHSVALHCTGFSYTALSTPLHCIPTLHCTAIPWLLYFNKTGEMPISSKKSLFRSHCPGGKGPGVGRGRMGGDGKLQISVFVLHSSQLGSFALSSPRGVWGSEWAGRHRHFCFLSTKTHDQSRCRGFTCWASVPLTRHSRPASGARGDSSLPPRPPWPPAQLAS